MYMYVYMYMYVDVYIYERTRCDIRYKLSVNFSQQEYLLLVPSST